MNAYKDSWHTFKTSFAFEYRNFQNLTTTSIDSSNKNYLYFIQLLNLILVSQVSFDLFNFKNL